MTEGQASFDLEPFRSYLQLLAEMGVPPRLRRVVAPSDIVQETLLEAHVAMERFEGVTFAQRAAWLRQILARNLANAARDQGRKKRDLARQVSLEERLEESSMRLGAWLAAEQSSPSEKLEREEALLELADALARLPPEQARVVLLRHAMGCSIEEIARETGRTGPAVAGLLRRGLKQVRETLDRR